MKRRFWRLSTVVLGWSAAVMAQQPPPAGQEAEANDAANHDRANNEDLPAMDAVPPEQRPTPTKTEAAGGNGESAPQHAEVAATASVTPVPLREPSAGTEAGPGEAVEGPRSEEDLLNTLTSEDAEPSLEERPLEVHISRMVCDSIG